NPVDAVACKDDHGSEMKQAEKLVLDQQVLAQHLKLAEHDADVAEVVRIPGKLHRLLVAALGGGGVSEKEVGFAERRQQPGIVALRRILVQESEHAVPD